MNKIMIFRNKIDLVDKEIVKKIAARFEVVKKIGKLKRAGGLAVVDKKREEEMYMSRKKLAKEFGVDFLVIEKIFELLIKESKRLQK